MKMHASFLVHGDPTRAGFRKCGDEFVGILNHQVAIEDGVGKSFAQRGHDQRPNREIRNEMSVHHVAMDHRAAALQRRFCFLCQPREVRGKYRRCQFNGHGQRAAPSLPQGKEIIRGSSSMLAKSMMQSKFSHHHGIVQPFSLLARANSSMRMTSSAYSGVTANSARPRMASRTFE